MEIMYLIDTNIFLEILLSQKQKDRCKEFLVSNEGTEEYIFPIAVERPAMGKHSSAYAVETT